MTSLSEILRRHHDEIVRRWSEESSRAAAARGLDGPELSNMMPRFLEALADAGEDLGSSDVRARRMAEAHCSTRVRQGFQLGEITEEFAILGRAVARTWASWPAERQPEPVEIERLFETLHLASVSVVELFTRHMLDEEQLEKRYSRLLRTIARDALAPEAPPLSARLEDVLEVVREAMGAKTAALLLFDPETEALETVVSVGTARERVGSLVSSLAPSTFVGQVASREATTTVLDVETTELEVSEELRKSGVHALLGVRLPPYHKLSGLMYVGLDQTRAFTPHEVHRLETLGEQLLLHLDGARMFATLRKGLAELQAERELRERFVSVLAHDLRGPLAAAKLAAQMLESKDDPRGLAKRVARNIERADRMIRDLLDANRIRAGEALPTKIVECDLAAVASEVVDDLAVVHGPRFVVEAHGPLKGYWSDDQLRRALWNLASNAVKYGTPETPVTIALTRVGDRVLVSVHNEGPAITADDQKRLFKPFSRTPSAQAGIPSGWGLGLTLVRGFAEAHGGHVSVESEAGKGTTFTIDLPLDARG